MVIALFFALILTFHLASAQRLTFDLCRTSAHCSAMQCVHPVDSQLAECTSSSYSLLCHCRRPVLTPCTNAFNCPTSEICSNQIQGGAVIGKCLSASYAQWLSTFNSKIVLMPLETTAEPAGPTSESTVDGYTGYVCTHSDQCVGSRQCYNPFNRWICTDGTASLNCICIPHTLVLQKCKGGDCGEGEVCANEVDAPGREDDGFCISRRGAKAVVLRIGGVEIDEKAVCVGMQHLQHLSKDQLVYERNRLARILCDSRGSCATPGHMVVFRGQPMMMKRYCENVGCHDRVGYVNSVRYQRGVVVTSRTAGLVFSAFAARYSSRMEEGVLAFVVRAGLV